MTGQQHPTREQIALDAEHLRVCVASLLLNRQYNGSYSADLDAFYEGRTPDEQDDALATADAVLALFPQPTPSAEVQGMDTATAARVADMLDSHLARVADGSWSAAGKFIDAMADFVVTLRKRAGRAPAAPLSIADMAPGTTFTARFTNGTADRRFERTGFMAPVRLLPSRLAYWEEDIDPSTIRDVTPPPTTPEAN